MKLSNTLQIFVLLFVVFAVGCSPKLQTTQSKFNIVQNIPENIERWEKDIVAFEEADKIQRPKKGGIVFVGSSSIVGWKTLAEDFPDQNTINRGFGGSQTDEVHYYAYRILYPYKPKQVVVYVGDNDLNAGKSTERVFNDLKDFFDDIRLQLPKTKITFLAIKPSPSRWHLIDSIKKTNAKVEGYLNTMENASYVDILNPMLMDNGRPNPAYYLADSLHMTAAGYDVWVEKLKPHLE
ncbi:GDSL-type esterase/lipase family protein [Albibacterium profundi]|uniref:GDSL-type esterase/lipase family protein n=1 Tax=Albibacterium profundi TaxID=3134906 RepID=A0ABV5CF92_9SPHI